MPLGKAGGFSALPGAPGEDTLDPVPHRRGRLLFLLGALLCLCFIVTFPVCQHQGSERQR